MRSRCGRRAFRASPIRCVGERIMATGVPEFREVAWRACCFGSSNIHTTSIGEKPGKIKGQSKLRWHYRDPQKEHH
ncbi:hypothetical protein [Bathymodiolus japonicus methanotrophic gill symbiont]|uniref:hypothetical protein n=1 Tax=Bathymodiolus japonicus methanotrophic gill symbiont TaxID=113269 RepID=UPI001C8D873A|nr:hypothetical protein [Bathymodiolus japonicus methanotrophic gill symbiont]